MATNALILSGGGARAAYQVGVLTALNEVLPSSTHNPFPIICGTSAGAINALALATHTGHYYEAVADLQNIWRELTTARVYKTGWTDVLAGGFRLIRSLFHEGVASRNSIALLDNQPLREFLYRRINFARLDEGVNNGDLKAVCVTAMNYSTGESVSFYQGHSSVQPWRRYRRIGVPTKLDFTHLMASAAIPGLFPAVKIKTDHYGDGALRQLAPLSPALHMGADRLFVIGVSANRNPVMWTKASIPQRHSPSIAQVFGHLFSSAFIDGLEGDLEHIERINELLRVIPDSTLQAENIALRPIDTLIISPSKALNKIAGRKVRYMPRSVRFFLRATGGTAKMGGATTASYLMFEPPFINELIELGYQDAMWERGKLQDFFQV
ncbi:MAG: patatin-like phospholipase family protein [Gammaproteobacteria bacterium]|uniref:patatin-like phospholipase family protein n=1 Tax=Pseudomaricurvus alcaniphilus TaxID=1166482 RepID=UPI0014084D72|nr:patatin-like phospholipase family protein [Pseudomaricurvus alcaniphilus]MBR9911669.1 patatin-like phospholipase family protein [Gammaproteobacteria bacterium]NHN39386.1 patatin-like phospholipase family protein [Pseudomaricurvus alcaniphilus]